MWNVIDTKTGDVIGRYVKLKSAHKRANRLDLEYGSVRYLVQVASTLMTISYVEKVVDKSEEK